MKMKKMLAALLAAAMSLSLVACGTSNPPANNSGSAGGSGSGTPDPAPSGDKVALNVIAAQYGDLTKDWWAQFQNDFNAANEGKSTSSVGVMDRFMVFDNEDTDDKVEAIKTFFDFFYEDTRYSEWVIMENFLPATSTGGEIMAAADPDAASWIEIVGSAKFYPTAQAKWADVKQGVINVEQQALLGGNVQELLDALQVQIAG